MPIRYGGMALSVIYADSLFLLNAVVDYLLLLCAARIAGEPLYRLRFAVSAGLGGLYSVAIFLPGLLFLSALPCRAACCCLMMTTAYGRSRRLLRQCIIFLLLTMAFGGCVVAVELLSDHTLSLGGGVVYSEMDLKMLLLSAAICYAVVSLFFARAAKHTMADGSLAEVQIEKGGKQVRLMAFLDTGNSMTDPVTGHPVLVAEGAALAAFLPEAVRPWELDLDTPIQTMERLNGLGLWGDFRLIPYRTVGVSRGMMLAMKVDRIMAMGQETEIRLVALSATPISDGGGYQALLSPGVCEAR